MPLRSPWQHTLKHAPSFPERLDDDFSAISIRTRLPAAGLIDQNVRADDLDVRLVFRTPRTAHLGLPVDDSGFDLRLEFLDFADLRYDGLTYCLSPMIGKTFSPLCQKLGLSLDVGRMSFGNHHQLGKDPGDLPDVFVADGVFQDAGSDLLYILKPHAKLSILSDPRIELFRLP